MAERHSFWPPGLRAVAARRSKALSSSAPPCQISPHAPTRPGSTCRNDAGMMDGCGEHASGTAAHSQGRSRRSREGGAWVGAGARESRSAARACARGVSRLIFHHWYKRPKTARAPRARALASPQHSHSKSKDAASRAASGFFDQNRDVSESTHGSTASMTSIERQRPPCEETGDPRRWGNNVCVYALLCVRRLHRRSGGWSG